MELAGVREAEPGDFPRFIDVEGQTAVTQGASSMILKALEESKWFIPLEREGLSNLLNERKIKDELQPF